MFVNSTSHPLIRRQGSCCTSYDRPERPSAAPDDWHASRLQQQEASKGITWPRSGSAPESSEGLGPLNDGRRPSPPVRWSTENQAWWGQRLARREGPRLPKLVIVEGVEQVAQRVGRSKLPPQDPPEPAIRMEYGDVVEQGLSQTASNRTTGISAIFPNPRFDRPETLTIGANPDVHYDDRSSR